jgi:hypothetical protein
MANFDFAFALEICFKKPNFKLEGNLFLPRKVITTCSHMDKGDEESLGF